MPGMAKTLLPALLIGGLSVGARAQSPSCDVDEGTPAQVARAVLDIQIAQSTTKPEDVANKLKDAVKLLSEGDLKKNPTGRAFVLGKTLAWWLNQPGMASGMTTRGALGFTTEPTAPYDIIANIDSLFTIVEKSNPTCEAQTTAYRQQKSWVDMVNHAIELGNAGNYDSATIVAKRSLQLSRKAPYGFMVLAQAASKANKPAEAISQYKLAIAAATDTSQVDVRRQLQYTLGNYVSELAEDAGSPAAKDSLIKEAKAAFEALAKDPGTKFADAARSGQARVATLSGDTTAIKSSYADQLANPSAFSYTSLMMAAVSAAKAEQTKDAIKLFEAARTMNPYHRDVLYNLARLYLLDSAYAKGIPVARELIKVDPSNSDNYQLIAIAYASMNKGYSAKQKDAEARAKALGQRANTSKSAAVQKAAIDSAGRMNAIIKAYGDSSKAAVDSAIKYNTMTLPAKVTFTEFTPSADKTTLGGNVMNNTDAARPFALKIEFLDKSGNVVSSQDVNVGPVEAHKSATFTATGTGAGIMAFRYAPIS
ncbi:MAG TPA: tetratricopeptide repeat protein [Gemmatimonadaceae bacterium]|jgi:tetratricopeptide (TPR) repeat protein|nr:tetratricopeptide repeat protein [Gemmatimonadaceae bacterium]